MTKGEYQAAQEALRNIFDKTPEFIATAVRLGRDSTSISFSYQIKIFRTMI